MTFRVGQRVRCIEQQYPHEDSDRVLFKNRIYTVKKVLIGGYVILAEIKRNHNFHQRRFELVQDTLLPEDLFNV